VGAVQAQLGPEGRKAWELANGIDHSPLLPHQREEVVSEHLTFRSPTVTRSALLMAVETLLGRAFAQPQARDRYVRTTTIEGRVLGQAPWVRRFAFQGPVHRKDRAFAILKNSLESITLPGPLEDLKLTLAGFTGESGLQASLFSDVRRREQLKETMRQLEAHLGCRPPIFLVRDVEPWSRIPERRQVLVPFDP
jgi:DNA polymerase-4/protein ImuB